MTDCAEPIHGWAVRVSHQSSWGKTYGMFPDYDAAVQWCRDNGWHPSECLIQVVNQIQSLTSDRTEGEKP